MSSPTKRQFTCPNCGLEQEFGVWETVNATSDPNQKQQLLQRQLGQFACKGCNRKLTIRHPILYNDVKSKFMVWLPHGDTSKPSVEEGSVIMNMMAKTGYKFRAVDSYNELLEKIRIFDDDQDDRAVELLKQAFNVRQKGPSGQKLFYDGMYQKAAAKKVVRLAEVKKEGTVVHELPVEELQRMAAALLKAPADEAGKWLRVDGPYATELIRSAMTR
jgi:hypothetical protein